MYKYAIPVIELILLSVFVGSILNPDRFVTVKYRDTPVNVKNFTEYKLKKSSFVHEILYDESEKYLLVRLKNTFYHYCNINESTVESWVSSKSLGRFYVSRIKGSFGC